MSNRVYSEIRDVRLPALLDSVLNGGTKIPRQPKGFGWPVSRCLKLLDSIYKGYPIGQIVVWRTTEHVLETQPKMIGSDEFDGVPEYLLDGLHRVNFLFSVLGPGLYTKNHLDKKAVGRWSRRVYFDLFEANAAKSGSTLFCIGDVSNDTWLPLDFLYDPYKLQDFQNGLSFIPGINLAESAANIFKDYRVPVASVITEDMGHVTEIIKRTNGGKQNITLEMA